MSSDRLTPFSFVVLALVGRGGAGPHDLVRMARSDPLYWGGAESQYYAEPKRLERLGYLRARKEPGRTRERTHYELTDEGLAALRAWLAEPAPFPRISHEAAVKVMAADLVDPAVTIGSLEALKDELAAIRARLAEAQARLPSLPHREPLLRLNYRLAERIVDAHEDWIEEIESLIGPRAVPGDTGPRG